MGTGPVLLASAMSALVWNFFYIPPHFTFHIEKPEDILMFGMFFIIALLNGVLTTRVRRQEKLAVEREQRTNALFLLTKGLSKANSINEVLKIAVAEIKNNFFVNSHIILQDGNNNLYASESVGKVIKLTQSEYDAAVWAFKNLKPAGQYTENLSPVEYTYYPLTGTRLSPGVLIAKLNRKFQGDQKIFWDSHLTQITNALEREFLDELAQKARFLDESDKLYKTLFNSISHELRIPVATIMGATDTLLTSSHSGNIQVALYKEIFTASLRLNRLIENLLNMSRLENGRISVRLDWCDMNDVINQVSEELKEELKSFSMVVSISEDMPLVKIDYGLMEQAFYNLLINSCEHAPSLSEINLDVQYDNGELVILVMDRGPGFPEGNIDFVFEKFFRTDGSKAGGLGLGLSIVKGFVEAHKGRIIVENRKDGGSKFTIRIPSEIINHMVT